MATKSTKKPKSIEASRLIQTIASKTSKVSEESPTRASSEEDQDNMPLIWEKATDRILQTFNSRFDAVEQTLKTLQSAQNELLEKIRSVEGQINIQDSRLQSLERSVSTLEGDCSLLRSKIDDQSDSRVGGEWSRRVIRLLPLKIFPFH